jgi:hypothetical protein
LNFRHDPDGHCFTLLTIAEPMADRLSIEIFESLFVCVVFDLDAFAEKENTFNI